MEKKILRGRAWVFGDDVDTDLIYHNKYLAETDPKKMPQYSFEYYPGKENFAKEVKEGDFIVAGTNFGCGSSREHAVYCLKYAGIPVVLAESFSRIYYRNAINNGYPVLFVNGLSQAIKDGKIYADPIQVPDKMGVEIAKAIVAHSKGQTLPPQTRIPTQLYRQKDGLADPELK